MPYNSVMITFFWILVSMTTVEVLGQRGSSGMSRIQPRVIGGAEVWNRCMPPYSSLVALQFQSSTGPFTFCSAVMLTDTFLVTSGYCALQISILGENPITAVVGERDMYMRDTAEQRIHVQSFKIHPQYNDTTFDNNIALLRLATRATISSCVKPALKFENDPTACTDLDQSCLIAGWGSYVESRRPSNSRLPRYASVAIFGDLVTSLWSSFQQGRNQPVGSLFAEAINPNRKVCFFDWGGIVSCLRNGNYVLRGVIGEHNCNTDSALPFLVTDVPYYQTWIDKCVSDWNRC